MAGSIVPIHGRDHCPGGPDPIPCLASSVIWIERQKTSSQSISNGTNDTQVLFDASTSAGSTDPDYTGYFDLGVSSTDKHIRILQAGVYEVFGQLQWDSNKVEGSVVSLNSSLGFTWNKGFYDEQNAGHTIEHNQTFNIRRRFPASTLLGLYVVHFAGVSRSIESAWWEIQRVGDYSGNNPTD